MNGPISTPHSSFLTPHSEKLFSFTPKKEGRRALPPDVLLSGQCQPTTKGMGSKAEKVLKKPIFSLQNR